MEEKTYYVKIYASSIEAIDEALGDAVGKNINGYYVLTENNKSLAHLHREDHMFVERSEANDLSDFLEGQDTCCG
jgi:hypothetical protein